jgi:ribosomal protein S18 acetylase RimI-like enzyme
MRRDDLTYAALLHESCLPGGFFDRLGHGFLKAYYESFAASPYAVALTATVGEAAAGVLVGTVRNGAHYRWVLRTRWPRFLRLAVAGILARPLRAGVPALRRVGRYAVTARLLLRPRRPQRPRPGQHSRRRRSRTVRGVLTHVAVAPGARGLGLGFLLTDRFLELAAASGVDEVRLVTLAGTGGAGAFYAAAGWEHTDTRSDWDGHTVDEWRRRVTPSLPPPFRRHLRHLRRGRRHLT